MTGETLNSTIAAPMELCEHCKSGVTYQYDFNKRCCRARHTLQLDKPRRAALYARLLEKEGREYTEQRMADVKALHRYRSGVARAAGESA
jgi:hypothetical protein